jgi:hypothetical protein
MNENNKSESIIRLICFLQTKTIKDHCQIKSGVLNDISSFKDL